MAQRANSQVYKTLQFINDEDSIKISTTTVGINIEGSDDENNHNEEDIQYVPLQHNDDQKYTHHTKTTMQSSTKHTISRDIPPIESNLKSTSNATTLNASAASFTPRGYSKNKPSLKCKVMDTITEQKSPNPTTPTNPTSASCEWCKKKSDRVCLACGEAFYCSKECQQRHWLIHRAECKGFDAKKDQILSKENGYILTGYKILNKLRCSSVSVSKEFTQNIIPQTIAEEIHDVYGFMDKAMAFRDNKIVFRLSSCGVVIAVNFGFHHKESKQALFCIITKTCGGKAPWRMRNELLTAQNMNDEFNVLPRLLPAVPRLVSLHTKIPEIQSDTFKSTMIDAFAETKWSQIPSYYTKKTKKRRVLFITNKEFINVLQQHLTQNINIISIISVQDDTPSLENVAIIHLTEDMSIGISFKVNSSTHKMAITGIYLDKNKLLTSHELASSSHTNNCHCLDHFKSNIDELRIGNVDQEQNQINALRKANKELRKENKSPVIKYIKQVLNDAGDMITKNTSIALSAIKQIFNIHTIKEAIHNYLQSKHAQCESSSLPITTNSPMSYLTTICGSYATTIPLPHLPSVT